MFGPAWLSNAIYEHGDVITVHGSACFRLMNENAGEFFKIHARCLVGGIIGIGVEPRMS